MSAELPLTDELASVFARLSGLLLSEETVKTALAVVTQLAAETIPGTIGAGVTLVDDEGRKTMSGATSALVAEANSLQYQLNEGPCLSAWSDHADFRIDDMASDHRWPSWAPSVARLGLHSALTTPLVAPGMPSGAMNVYALSANAFSEHDQRLLSMFAAQAAILLANVQSLENAQRLSAQHKDTLRSRDVIGMAKGVLMSRDGVDENAAFAMLASASQRESKKLRHVAEDMLVAARVHLANDAQTPLDPLHKSAGTKELEALSVDSSPALRGTARHRSAREEKDLAEVLGSAVRDALSVSENSTPVEAVEAVTRTLGAALGANGVALLLADLSGRALVRLSEAVLVEAGDKPVAGVRRARTESAAVLPFDGGPHERALVAQRPVVLAPGDEASAGDVTGRWTVIAPISERGDAAGLLEMSLPDEPTRAVVEAITRIAHLLAFVLIAARRHTDLFEWGQRTVPFTLSAEIQRRLLPPAFTCEAGAFTLSAWLEPAGSVGGDTFDYSAARDHVRLSITDAMGHGVAAALAATACLASLRGTRRAGGSLREQAINANNAMRENGDTIPRDMYVTGLLGELDLRTGALTLVNAGHIPPYLAPADGGTPYQITLTPDHPFGMFAGTDYSVRTLNLSAGDRLVFVTDGITERNAAQIDIPAAILGTRDLHPREAARALVDIVVSASGRDLADDATLLVLDWHDTHGLRRDAASGADTDMASHRIP